MADTVHRLFGGRISQYMEFTKPRIIKRPNLYAAFVAVVYTLWFWPVLRLMPDTGLDASWAAGLALAVVDHKSWGKQILFTYGPLGYLAHPNLYYERTAVPAVAFAVLSEATLFFLITRALLRAVRPWIALSVAWLIGALMIRSIIFLDLTEMLAVVIALLALEWVSHETQEWRQTLSLACLAFGAAFLLFVKFSTGIDALAAVAGVTLLRSYRHLAAKPKSMRASLTIVASATAAFVLGLLVVWLLTGQPIRNLAAFITGSVQIARGYSSAMSIEGMDNYWLYPAIILFATVILALAYKVGRDAGRQGSIAYILVIGLVGFGFFKEGFVRQDPHEVLFVTGATLLTVALWPHIARWGMLPFLFGSLVLVVLVSHVFRGPLLGHDGPSRAVETLEALVSRTERRRIQNDARTELEKVYESHGLEASQISLLKGHTVHIDPYETTLAWVYPQMRWDPPPVFQSYSAYTMRLDALNAAFLDSPKAPSFILRHRGSLDNRDPRWESPAYMLAMVCNYRQVSSGLWQVLKRVPNRCGKPITAGIASAAFGQSIAVPLSPQNSLTVASIEWPSSAPTAIEALIVHAPLYNTALPGGAQRRFVSTDARAWHVLSVPDCFDWDTSSFSPRTQPTMTFMKNKTSLTDHATVRIRFATVPFDCSTEASPRS